MKIKETIGIDVSKLVLDARVHSSQTFSIFDNKRSGFKKLVAWAYKNSSFKKDEILFVFEHTGLYSLLLAEFLASSQIPFSMISGLEIKRSLGISRGKDDKIDAAKIALYGYRLRDEIQLSELRSKDLNKLQHLLVLRERLVRHRTAHKSTLTEQRRVLVKKDNKALFEVQEKLVDTISKQIQKVENEANQIIKNDKRLLELFQLVTSVKGIGPLTAMNLIVFTGAFTKFENWRKFASYCGIAPFPNTSGSSIRGKTRVSPLANKKAKSLLDMCAKSAIMNNPEMKAYYQLRVAQGKNKMSTINIIRNKLLARVFAVVNRGTPYVNTMKYAA